MFDYLKLNTEDKRVKTVQDWLWAKITVFFISKNSVYVEYAPLTYAENLVKLTFKSHTCCKLQFFFS